MGAEGFTERGEAREREMDGVGDSLGVGDVLGDCEILGLEGFGAMGAVYRARQRSLGRTVALKVIREAFASTPQYRERFLREARLAASVDHPHVVSVFDAGEQAGRLFLTMQWVQGEDLKRLLQSAGRLSPGEVVTIVSQVAAATAAIHAAGLIHRDIKPANVVVRDVAGSDHAYLTDFGLAKPTEGAIELTEVGYVLGTPGYLSPEQIEGGRPGPRSDLYALGCVAFELLTGERPFRRDSELALLMAHAQAPRPRPSELVPTLGTRYDAFFATALAIDPDERFASGRELGDALRAAHVQSVNSPAAVSTAGAPTAPAPTVELPLAPPAGHAVAPPTHDRIGSADAPLRHPRRRRRWPIALLATLAVAAASFGAVMLAGALTRHRAHGGQQTVTQVQTQPPPPPGTSTANGKPAPPQPSSRYCGGDLTAGPYTTCGFARNVELAYDQGPGGATTVTAISPATGTTYTLRCTGGSMHVCTGGRGASMTFSSDPGNPVPFVACDPNISAGPETTCAFAENVFLAYYHAWKAQGAAPVTQAQAFSPKTNRTYRVICATGSPGTGGAGSGGTATTGGAGSGGAGSGGTATTGGTAPSGGSSVTGGSQPNAATEVSCSTTEGALITFPLAAVVAYKPQ